MARTCLLPGLRDPCLVQTLPKKGSGEVEDGGKLRGGCGAAGCIAPGWKHAAARGLRDVLNHYSQVKYQVVVALFGDAVVEPHCGRDRRVTGYARLPPAPQERLGSPLGTKRSRGRAEGGSFLLPPPLAIAAAWVGGLPAQWGTSALASASGSSARLKGHIQIRGCPGLAPGRGPGQLPGYLGRWAGCRHGCPSPLPRRERCPGAGGVQPGRWAASSGTDGAFLFSAHDLSFLLGTSQVGDIQESQRDEFPSEEALSRLAPRPDHHAEGSPLPSGTPGQVQPGANLPSSSQLLVFQA